MGSTFMVHGSRFTGSEFAGSAQERGTWNTEPDYEVAGRVQLVARLSLFLAASRYSTGYPNRLFAVRAA